MNCSKWALTSPNWMPVISLGWSLTHCKPAAGEQASLTHCQRGRKPKGLLACNGLRIMSLQNMWHMCNILYLCGIWQLGNENSLHSPSHKAHPQTEYKERQGSGWMDGGNTGILHRTPMFELCLRKAKSHVTHVDYVDSIIGYILIHIMTYNVTSCRGCNICMYVTIWLTSQMCNVTYFTF